MNASYIYHVSALDLSRVRAMVSTYFATFAPRAGLPEKLLQHTLLLALP